MDINTTPRWYDWNFIDSNYDYWVETQPFFIDDFDKWCDDNLSDWHFGYPEIIEDGGPVRFRYWFKYEEDKVKFILKWL